MQFPGFEIIAKLGEGKTTAVWQAHQVSLDRLVVVKLLKPGFTADPKETEELVQEVRSLAKLKHPNILQVYDVAEQDGVYYFVLEYVEGITLKDYLLDRGRVRQSKALNIAWFIAEALRHAWERLGLIHRNIRPGNIMIDEDGTVKVMDLGQSTWLDAARFSTQLQTGILRGIPNYISPEQAKCSVMLDYRTDMYSLGATLYHMTTGQMPFENDHPLDIVQKHISDTLPNPRKLNPSLSVNTANVIMRLMMKDPSDRYSNWSQAIKEIERAAAGKIVMAKQRPGAGSTVEGAQQMKTPGRRNVSRGRNSRSYAAHESSAPVPFGLSLVAWILIIAWWAFLAIRLFRLPPLA